MSRRNVNWLEVRRDQFEIVRPELLKEIVRRPAGHIVSLGLLFGRESASTRTLRFPGGTDGSKVYTREFRTSKSRLRAAKFVEPTARRLPNRASSGQE